MFYLKDLENHHLAILSTVQRDLVLQIFRCVRSNVNANMLLCESAFFQMNLIMFRALKATEKCDIIFHYDEIGAYMNRKLRPVFFRK